VIWLKISKKIESFQAFFRIKFQVQSCCCQRLQFSHPNFDLLSSEVFLQFFFSFTANFFFFLAFFLSERNKNWKLLLYNRKSQNIWENGIRKSYHKMLSQLLCRLQKIAEKREGDTINNQYIIGQLQRSSITI
jgi:hypothetical protein